MVLKLKDIATVSTGVTFRSRIEASPSGNVRIIQMKDLGKDNIVHLDQAVRIDYTRAKPSQLARIGDIIFRSRGHTNTAALLQEEVGDAVVTAPLFRIRSNTIKVIPEFLLWWINQPSSQAYLRSRSIGTMVKMVSKQGLEDLEVSLPPLRKQHEIAEFFNLSLNELCLLEKIKNRKALFTQGILMQIASESHVTANNQKPGIDAVTSTLGQTHTRSRS